jgi:hypothetical protein
MMRSAAADMSNLAEERTVHRQIANAFIHLLEPHEQRRPWPTAWLLGWR